jgi:hypothetical protein
MGFLSGCRMVDGRGAPLLVAGPEPLGTDHRPDGQRAMTGGIDSVTAARSAGTAVPNC